MTTYNTGNPVPSGDARDRFDNTQTLDELVNSPVPESVSRLGISLKTWHGIRQMIADYLAGLGYESAYLTYAAGVVVERQTQLVQREGELYRVANIDDLPLTLTGTWATDAPKLQAVGDAALRQALLLPTGSTMMRHLGQLVSEKFGERASIRDYGGGEEMADNFAALEATKAAVGLGGVIHIPKLSTGEYTFVGGPVDLRGYIVVPERGVRFLTPTGFHIFSSEVVVTEDLVIRVTTGAAQDYEYVMRKNFNKGTKAGKKDLWLSSAEIRDTRPLPILASSELKYLQVQLGVSDTFTSISPAGSGADSLSFTPPTGGNTQLGLYPIRPGEQMTAGIDLLPDANGEIAVGFTWSTGYCVLRGASAAGAWTLSTKYAGVPVVETPVVRPDGNGDTPGYFPAQNHFTIRFLAYNRAQILISGIVAVEVQLTSGYLMFAGFGGTSVSAITPISWTGWYRSKFAASEGVRTVVLGACGDSMTDDLQSAWMWAAARALDGSLGIRVGGIENRAVSGDTTQQQLNRLSTTPFVNASDVVIFLGPNDIQTANTLANFKTSYSGIIDELRLQGRRVSLVIPPLWYTQAQTGGAGVAAVRAEYGGNIRAAIGRFAADYGLPLVDLSNLSGPISAGFLSNAFTDPMLRDNLHETAYANEIFGEAIARGALAPQIVQVPDKLHPWVPLASSVYGVNFSGTLQYRININGDVELRGTATLSTGSVTDGLTAFTLPEHLKPQVDRRAAAFGNSVSAAYTGNCILRADAQVKVYNLVGATTVSFDNVSFSA